MRSRSALAVLLLMTGCTARTPAPVVTPEPQPAAPAPAPVAVATDTAQRDTADAVPVVSDSEVVQRAAAIFDGVPARTESGPMPSEPRSATWDIDVRSYETHEMVAQYVGIFTGRAREYMQRSISRGTRYDAMLRRKFREAGLPEDMTYLALIESSYLTSAYSRAAAVGMWQFMAPTARGIGMRVDWWVDERRDPNRATEGAIDFLTDLHDAYGSWYLAAAAYNGGPGRVSRGLRRFSDEMDGAEGEDRFFALAEQKYLPSETKAYVPKLIAAAMVAKEPGRYGLRVDTLPPYEYDSVTVAGGVALAAVAKAAGTTVDAIKDLNPHFLRGVTPPGEESEVRIPLGSEAQFRAAFGEMPAADRAGWREERLTAARSAQAIADEAGVPMKSLFWLNPKLSLDRRGNVRAGTSLRIPTTLAVAGARDVPDPNIARYSSRRSPAVLVAQRVRVRRGESLASVARRAGVSVAALRSMNGIRNGRLRAGQVLVVRRPSRKAIEAARREAAARSRAGAGQRCSTRVVRVRGKRRTVRSCVAAPRARAAEPRSTTRGGRAAKVAPKSGRRGSAAATPRRGRAAKAAPRSGRRSGARSPAPAPRRAPAKKPSQRGTSSRWRR